MSKVFTKKDIEFLSFNESFTDISKPRRLYEYLTELASQDIYVVDVTLLHTTKDNYLIHNYYMIRIVRPVFDVEVKIYHYNDFTDHWYHYRTEVFGDIMNLKMKLAKKKKNILTKTTQMSNSKLKLDYSHHLINQFKILKLIN